jgi:hypothetical protein
VITGGCRIEKQIERELFNYLPIQATAKHSVFLRDQIVCEPLYEAFFFGQFPSTHVLIRASVKFKLSLP